MIKKITTIALILLGAFLSPHPSLAQNPEKPDYFQNEKAFYQKLLENQQGINHYNYDIVFQRMEQFVNPSQLYLNGIVTSYYVPKSGMDSLLRFDMAQSLTPTQILYHGQNLSFTHSDKILNIQLPAIPQAGILDSIQIVYEGSPGSNLAYMLDYHGPLSPNVPVLFTNSEPYYSRDWWPCKQSLDDKIDSLDMIIHVPSAYRSASNGLIVSDTLINGERITHWKHRYPIAHYLVAFAVSNYQLYKQAAAMPNGDSLKIDNYLFPEQFAPSELPSDVLPEILEFYNELFIPYPFATEKYGQASWTRGGAMENQTMTFTVNYNFTLMAHELAHHWFGNYITCGNWHEIWLNESFATFVAAWAVKEFYDEESWTDWLNSTKDAVTADPGGSVYVNDTSQAGNVFDYRLVYQKGALMLNMLRWEIGDQAFFNGIRSYLNDSSLAFNTAHSEQLISNWESAADTSLTEFFNDWLYGQGYPRFSIDYSQDAAKNLHLSLNQSTSDSSVSLFELHIPLKIFGTNTDTLIILHQLQNHEERLFPLSFEVSGISFDPYENILTVAPFINHVIDPENPDMRVSLSPNPAHDLIQIVFARSLKINTLTVFNSEGRLIIQKQYGGTYSQKLELPIHTLAPGKYILRIDAGWLFTQAFIKI